MEDEEEEDSLDDASIADRLSSVSVSSLCSVAEPRRRSEEEDIRSLEESSTESKSFCLNS